MRAKLRSDRVRLSVRDRFMDAYLDNNKATTLYKEVAMGYNVIWLLIGICIPFILFV